MKKFFLFIVIAASALSFNSCSKDDNKDTLPDGKNMKFTISATGLQATDDFILVFTGGVVDGSTTTLFKVNNQIQSNTIDIQITKEQLMAGPVVVESVTPLYVVAGTLSAHSGTAGHTFSYIMKSEIGGQAQPDKSATITTNAYSEQFSFK